MISLQQRTILRKILETESERERGRQGGTECLPEHTHCNTPTPPTPTNAHTHTHPPMPTPTPAHQYPHPLTDLFCTRCMMIHLSGKNGSLTARWNTEVSSPMNSCSFCCCSSQKDWKSSMGQSWKRLSTFTQLPACASRTGRRLTATELVHHK